MKLSKTFSYIVLTAGFLAVSSSQAATLTDQEVLEMVRGVIKADRQSVVTEVLQLTPAESEKFWPVYHEYRAKIDFIAGGLQKLVLEYGQLYPNVPEDRAKSMLKELLALEDQLLETREACLKKLRKGMPADKILRFAQVENRLDLALRLQLAAAIPLVPIEGKFGVNRSASTAIVPGVPGGVGVQTYDVTATVAAIDKEARKVTLVNAAGIKKTVKVGPDAINFDQIRVGDQVKVSATEELVVQMGTPGAPASDGAAALVALAPKGAKPGGVMAETTQITGTIKSIDTQYRTATLQFEDGATRTFPVRGDIDLKQYKAGDQVVIRITEVIALTVEKP